MKYKVKLIYGSFFFSGPVSITGKNNEVEIDESEVTPDVAKAITAAAKSGIIETDITEFIDEAFPSEPVVDDNKGSEEVEPEVEETVSEETQRKHDCSFCAKPYVRDAMLDGIHTYMCEDHLFVEKEMRNEYP